jgi:hypothetical protein
VTAAERAQQRLQELASRLEPALRRAFLAMAASLTPERLAVVVALLEAGNLDAAVQMLTASPGALAATAAVRATWTSGLLRLVQQTTRDLNAGGGGWPGRVVVVAPVQSPELIAAVRRWDDLSFSRVRRDVQDGLRATIATELQRGIGPRQVAVALKEGVSGGLTPYDAKIIASFRQALEEGRTGDALRRTLRDRRYKITGTLTPTQIDTMVAAYRRKLVAFRAETFARTAAMQAANEASAASWHEAIRQGAIPASEVRRYWVVAADERLCAVCAPIPSLNPDGVALDGFFTTPNGLIPHPPVHPACRCVAFTRRESPLVRRAPTPGRPASLTDASRVLTPA